MGTDMFDKLDQETRERFAETLLECLLSDGRVDPNSPLLFGTTETAELLDQGNLLAGEVPKQPKRHAIRQAVVLRQPFL